MKTFTRLSILLFFMAIVFACKKDDPAPAVIKSSAKDITDFTISGVSATVDVTAKTIKASVPAGTDASKLAPTVNVSSKATVSPASGVAQDFTKAVTYTVTAEDGTSQAFTVTIAVNKYDYEIAIEAKYKAMGWDKDGHALFNGTGPVKTMAGKGYVQYYAFGSRKTAIYYYEGKGAFAMDTGEMTTYDNAGQDKFSFVVSDPKPCGTGCGYNDLIMTADNSEGINILGNFVYGNIYAKYKDFKRWDGPLGLPTSSETPGANSYTDKGRFTLFKNGLIVFRADIGTQAVWGKIYKLWSATDFERGWLRFPTTSCDINTAEGKQLVRFQNGVINGLDICGSYQNAAGETMFQNGVRAANPTAVPCYNP
jgi:hypothetical protein